MTFWMVCKCPEGVMFRICLKSDEFKASRTLSKMDDISRILAGVDDDFYMLLSIDSFKYIIIIIIIKDQ